MHRGRRSIIKEKITIWKSGGGEEEEAKPDGCHDQSHPLKFSRLGVKMSVNYDRLLSKKIMLYLKIWWWKKISAWPNFHGDYITNIMWKFQLFSTTVTRLFRSESRHVTSSQVMLRYVCLDLSGNAKIEPPSY